MSRVIQIFFLIILTSHLSVSVGKVFIISKLLLLSGGQDEKRNTTKPESHSKPSYKSGSARRKGTKMKRKQPIANDDMDKLERNNISDQKQKKGQQSLFSTGIVTATSALSFAKNLAKGTVKTAFDLCAVKHVTINQISGKWRLMQDIKIGDGMVMSCPATIEFREDGTVASFFDGKEDVTQFKFKERSWPRKCTIQFHAKAFQGSGDSQPVSMFYKGYFKRSMMNSNVLLLRGKVYRVSGKMIWKTQTKCGKFTGTKRRYS